jgi:hypothetical protein
MAAGTRDDPWVLKTPPGTSGYSMYEDLAQTRPHWSARSAPRSSGATCRPPLLEELGLAELTHEARNNRIRAIRKKGDKR